jgi:hypothetical protein
MPTYLYRRVVYVGAGEIQDDAVLGNKMILENVRRRILRMRENR